MTVKVLVHKAVEPDDLTKKGSAELTRLLHNGGGMLLVKYDGVYTQFIHTPDGWQAYSRTNERQRSIENAEVLRVLDNYGDTSRRYIGEIWLPKTPHSIINGLARKKTVQSGLAVVLHDSVLVRDGVVVPEIFKQRYLALTHLTVAGSTQVRRAEVDVVRLVPELDFAHLLNRAKTIQANGLAEGSVYDGMILRDPDVIFNVGSGTGGGNYKIKPRKSLDLRITAEYAEQRNTKLGGYVTVSYRTVPTDVGSGLSQEMLQKIFDAARNDFVYDPVPVYVGLIAEVEFLDITADGKLREPVLKAIRHDKTQPDS